MADLAKPMVARLSALLGSARIPLTDEKVAQMHLGLLLLDAGIEHSREWRMSDRDIPDFWLPLGDDIGLVVEVKMNSAQRPVILRQLARYAAHPRVCAICLISNKAIALPAEIEGKPAHFISLGRAWL